MNPKGFVNIILIVLVVILAGAVGYFALHKPTTEPITPAISNNVQPTQPPVTPPPTNTPTPSPLYQANKPGWKIYADAGFEVQYPENTFAVVQLTRTLPPDYKVNYGGMKLISPARVSKLGKQECSYGGSGRTVACNAQQEDGIEFIQVNASAQSLTSSLTSSLKTIVTLAGKQTVKWSIGSEGDNSYFYYIPLNSNRTLIVVEHYIYGGFLQPTLSDQILATLVIK